MLGPAHRAVCRRGDDFCNPRVQVYGCWESHGLSPFIVDLLRIYESGEPWEFSAASTDTKELRKEHRPVHKPASTNGCGFANPARTEAGVVPYYRIRAELQKLFRQLAGLRVTDRTGARWSRGLGFWFSRILWGERRYARIGRWCVGIGWFFRRQLRLWWRGRNGWVGRRSARWY
jgi:hypothetical protein